jgi:hypothetical protein
VLSFETVVLIIGVSSVAQISLLAGIFFRLGDLVSTTKTHGERLTKLERVLNNERA